MKLICVGSSSSGNSYALDSGSEILLLEAGIKMADVKRVINFRLNDVVGCVISHAHGDHAKYATEYAKFGVKVYCNEDVTSKKQFPYNTSYIVRDSITVKIGSFRVVPFGVAHDVPCFGYLIKHKDMGVMMFVTDTYKVPINITGINHYLIEANYSDNIIKRNFLEGKLDKSQLERIMLSHMSLDYTVKYLHDCGAGNAQTITLCHLSERNSDPVQFQNTVTGALGVPTYVAQKGLVVNINRKPI